MRHFGNTQTSLNAVELREPPLNSGDVQTPVASLRDLNVFHHQPVLFFFVEHVVSESSEIVSTRLNRLLNAEAKSMFGKSGTEAEKKKEGGRSPSMSTLVMQKLVPESELEVA